jgi:hypothetical protein
VYINNLATNPGPNAIGTNANHDSSRAGIIIEKGSARSSAATKRKHK